MASRKYSEETPRPESQPEDTKSPRQALTAKEQQALREECAQTALALTALFDGEASAEEAFLARTHLAECGNCDVLWQGWKQQTKLLRQISAPVPPGLLTRLLTAVRLLSMMPNLRARQEVEISHFQPKNSPVAEARLLSDVVFVTGANPFAPRRSAQRINPKIEAPRELPPLDPLSPLPPNNLRDDILRRTVGHSPVAVVPLQAPIEDYEPTTPRRALNSDVSRTRSRCSLHLSSSLMPALAAWLIFLAGPSKLWTPLLNSTPTPVPRVSAAKASTVRLGGFESKTKRGIVRKFAALGNRGAESISREVAAPDEAIESEKTVADSFVSGASERSEKSSMPVEKQPVADWQNATETAPLVAAEKPENTARPVETAAIVAVPKVEKPAPSLSLSALPKVTPAVHYAPATTTADLEIRTRRASWSAPVESAPTPNRSGWNEIASNHVAAPQPTNTDDNSDGASDAETLEHVNSLSDERPEDVRSVLDDYRASLLTENADTDATAGDSAN